MAEHTSIKMDSPVEFVNIESVNPLISKCQIKVCYVGEDPNRNRSIITKEVATKMAPSLRGCPIVGYYNEAKEDFEEHNQIIEISDGQLIFKDKTKPYGFVDLNAKVWFQKFLDDGENEREYLMTEGWLWTSQYPECRRIIEQGNNQSMELDEETLEASWSKDDKGQYEFFIINEAFISKLCILGEQNEPCFEGSNITSPTIQFSLGEKLEKQIYSMMQELKDYLASEGGTNVYTTYKVEIGDSLWDALFSYVENKFSSIYRIEGVFEEEDNSKFVVLQNNKDSKYYKMAFSFDEEKGFAPNEVLVEVTSSYEPSAEPQFALEAIEAYKKAQGKNDEEDNSNSQESTEEEEEICPVCGKPVSECTCEEDEEEKKTKHSLEELQTSFAELKKSYDVLRAENAELIQFKNKVERKEKEDMIASFVMLSDEDKQDVVTNIDKYSLDDIEAKLSVICVRNKVSFNLDEDSNLPGGATTYSLTDCEDSATPAWVKRALAVAKTLED